MSALRPMELLRVDPASAGAKLQLAVSPATGSAEVRIPIPLTAGRDGFGPTLALAFGGYDPLSPFAHGWSLAGLPSIDVDTRDGLPAYDGAERFRYAGQELVPLDDASRPTSWTREGHEVRVFRARLEAVPIRAERWTHQTTRRVHWRVRTGGGAVQVFGRREDAESRLADPADPRRTFRWLLESAFDRLGNAMLVRHAIEDDVGVDPLGLDAHRFASATANRYPKRILYGNAAPLAESDDTGAATWHFETVFDYGDHDTALPATTPSGPWPARQDSSFAGHLGFEIRTRRLCRRVLMFHRFPAELGEAETLVGSLELDHAEAPDASVLTRVRYVGWRTEGEARVSQATPWASVAYTDAGAEDGFRIVQAPLLARETRFVDLFGEGVAGLLTLKDGAAYYARNLGEGTFGAHEALPEWPLGLASGRLADLDRDGNLELFQPTGPLAGYYRFDRRERRWEPLRCYKGALNLAPDTGVLFLADMTGDGRSSVVLLHATGLTWFPSEGPEGLGDPVDVALPASKLPVASHATARFMADMTGDGLADLVEVQNGSVRYWPNLGRGRFGDPVEMDAAPRLDSQGAYDPARVLFVDLDQTGASDLVYLRADGAVLRASNRRGVSFGPLETIALGAAVPDLARIDLADVYGDGSRCLVVFAPSGAGSAALHVLRLTSAPGARQVRSVTHSLGAVTEIEWGHSVRHYLRDEAAGRGWDTPLPTHHAVVDALHHVEPIDGASARERLRYHDGHYDPRARSFGTFAVVDRLDVDTEGDVGEVVPLLTRSFWHTGEPDHASRFARHEYSGDPEALPAPACSVQAPPAPLARDLDEAFGALVGSPVREELYATDAGGTPASHPLRVITNSRAVSVVRASDDTYRTGVQIVPSDSQTSEYEQTPSDPRVSVQRQLAFDAYLTPVLAVQAGLPRREGGSHPFEAQARVVATAARSVAAHVDTEARFELGILVEGRTYELHAPTADAILAPNLESNIAIILDAASAYDEPLDPEGTELAARELTHQRAYYWDDTQTAALPLGSVGAIVLPHHSEDAAYDRGQLASVFGARVDPDVDLAPLGYVEDGDVFYRVGPTHRYTAAAGFYRLVEVEIYDGGVQRITPDAHHLTTVEAVDPVGNAVQAQIDYHVLAPYRLTDPNGTVQEIDYDPLGVQRRTSRYGTALDALGNVVDHGFGPLVPGEARPAFAAALADPEAALGGAESLLLYEHGSGGAPTQVMTLLAEELVHRGPDAATSPARARVSIAYLDGFGRAIQTRTRVEPGVAWTLDPGTGELVEAPVTTRWRVSGHVVLDAKQLPRAQYEPFFRDDHAFEAALARRQVGVATTTTYDALGRVTQRALPNGTLSRTTYRPWRQESSDPNDSVGLATEYVAARAGLAASDPERIALTQALENEGTPVSVHRDPLGRDIALVEVVEDDAELVERASLEVRGLSVATIDRRATVASTRQFDRLGRGLLESSMDAGSVRVLFDAADREVKRWREDTEERRVFDVAGRLLERHVTDGSTSWLAERITYGEGVAGAADRNQLGRVVLVEDGAGTLATTRYGAFGEPLASERTLVAAAGSDPDWSGSVPLEAVSYQGRAAFDALGRRTRALLPDGTERRHEYLRSGPASKLEVVTPDATVRTILVTAEYNARGQQTRVELGNGVEVSSDYDAQTFRLFRRRAVLGTDTYQDLRHHYDPVGNLVYVDDLAQRPDATHVINGLLVTAERVFRYDARYQLTEATGRAHNALTRADFRGDVPNAGSFRGTRRVGLNDGGAVARYRRTYAYDAGGNLLGWQHGPEGAGPGSTWSHEKWVSSTSNRSYLAYDLNGIAISDPQSKFDARGQITSLPNVQAMQWSPRDQLRRVVLIERTGDPDDAELYDYAADGSR
ncbi:MAG: hypothetical protein IT378_07820, partial [Sandaracinaceae bacterium]|nr:hypothetical protein [Sandaracinaceae bacterium]